MTGFRHTCPACGATVEDGNTECGACGAVVAVDQFGNASPEAQLWLGRLAAIAGVVDPLYALAAVPFALGLWVMHDRPEDAIQTAIIAMAFGFIGAATGGL